MSTTDRTDMPSDYTGATTDPTRRFLWRITTLLVLTGIVALAGTYLLSNGMIDSQALATARSIADLVAAPRSWDALHGDVVWVIKDAGVQTDPWLVRIGLSADATATGGRVFTIRDPRHAPDAISAALSAAGGATFRLTSVQPVDPKDAPDVWEAASLASFAAGTTEAWTSTTASGTPVLRYMRPIMTDTSCLTCHGLQGYRGGNVHGAITVTVPLAQQQQRELVNLGLIAGIGLVSMALVWISVLGLVREMSRRLKAAQAALVEAATTDELTQVASRRQTMDRLREEIERSRRSGRPLSLVMADIDHFKAVNDTYGHGAGDLVLKEVAARMAGGLRPYDLLGRIGGEEFLIIAPDTDIDGALAIAERARGLVAGDPIGIGDRAVVVTGSFGVTLIDPVEPVALDRSLARVDSAMYTSKEMGRNRVTVFRRETE